MLRYLHLVSYDIGDDKRQAVVREQVKNFAITGQKSAYECWITTDDKQNLANFAHHEIDNRDAFFIIKISHNYWQNLPKHCHIRKLINRHYDDVRVYEVEPLENAFLIGKRSSNIMLFSGDGKRIYW